MSHIISVARDKGFLEVIQRAYYFLYDKAYLCYRTIDLHLTTGLGKSHLGERSFNQRALFVDAGSNLGQGWRYFRKFYPPTHFDYELFEPNPNCIPFLENEIQTLGTQCAAHLNQAAVGTSYETLKFYGIDESEGGKLSDGGTTLKKGNSKKVEHSDSRSIDVASIDFADFIEKKSQTYSKIVIKMDIEGAEYSVLDKMLSENSFEKIETIFVEFHSRYMNEPEKSLYRQKEKELKRAIDKTSCKFVLWI